MALNSHGFTILAFDLVVIGCVDLEGRIGSATSRFIGKGDGVGVDGGTKALNSDVRPVLLRTRNAA